MAPGVNQLGNLGLSADTLQNISTAGKAARFGQAVQDKNVMGALSTGANLAGVTDVAGVPTRQGLQGLQALDDLANKRYLEAAVGGLRATDTKTLPGTDVPVDRAIGGANLYNAIRSKRPDEVLLSALDLAEPQSAIRRASGGVVPDLSQYMRTLPNGSRTDKLRGIAAIANGA
jgi:hypothetical protein